MRAILHALKVISVITLAFFSWSYLPLYQVVAFAATQEKQVTKAQVRNTAIQRPAAKLEKLFDDIREKTSKAGEKAAKGEDTASEIESIKSRKSEIDAIDIDLKKEFADTEKKLRASNLPKEILDRHNKFVKNYEDNLAELKANVDAIEKAKTTAALKTEIAKTKKHLDKIKPVKRHIALDPNNLPNKGRQIKHAAQEAKKPEEKKILPMQPLRKGAELYHFDNQGKSEKHRPILVASNGPLDGLASTSPIYEPVALPFTGNDISSGINPAAAFNILPSSAAESRWDGAVSSHEQFANLTTDSLILNSIIAATPPASAADLAETPEIQFTPAIKAKARELENKPLKIYEWVRNNIEFVPTYGSIQGADMCLQTKQCNDIDSASLLIALLRASNISARYVYGTIELPIEKVKNWLGGVTDPMVAGTILATSGIPAKVLISGGTVAAVQLEHVWVNAWINYIPSRGAVHRFGREDTWIPLDPSFKQYTYTQGIDISSAVPFDSQSFVNQIQSTATINSTDRSVTNVNSSLIQQTMQTYQAQVQNYIQQNHPNATVGDLIGKKEIINQEFPILLGTLPYKTVQVGSEFAAVPDSLRYKITFGIQDSNGDGTSLSYTTGIPALAGKRVTLSYIPATTTDEQVINNYGGIYNVPAYLVNVKPQIKIEGVVAATGNPIGLGKDQAFNMQFVSSAFGTESVSNVITAGAYYGIGLNPSSISSELINQRKVKMDSVKETMCVDNPYTDDCRGELLYTTAIGYFYELKGFEEMAAHSNSVIKMKDVSEAIVSAQVNVSDLFGVPTRVVEAGVMIDVDRNMYVASAKDGDQSKVRQFMMSAGQMSSILEHGIFESMYQAKGISTIQVLQLANSQGIPIYTLTPTNASSVLPVLQIASDVRTDIQNAINAGKNVVIPKTSVTYYGWTGTGYIIQDTQTGAGAYMISTSLANGGCCIAAGGLPVVFLSIIGATPWYDFHCQITTLIHYFNAPVEFVGLGTLTLGAGVIMIIAAYNLEMSALAAVLLGGFGFFVAFLGALILVALLMALINSYSHEAYIRWHERRIYGSNYDVVFS